MMTKTSKFNIFTKIIKLKKKEIVSRYQENNRY